MWNILENDKTYTLVYDKPRCGLTTPIQELIGYTDLRVITKITALMREIEDYMPWHEIPSNIRERITTYVLDSYVFDMAIHYWQNLWPSTVEEMFFIN